MCLPMPSMERSVRDSTRLANLIGGNDMFIAAHALAAGATIVTANVDELSRISDLKVENWLA